MDYVSIAREAATRATGHEQAEIQTTTHDAPDHSLPAPPAQDSSPQPERPHEDAVNEDGKSAGETSPERVADIVGAIKELIADPPFILWGVEEGDFEKG